MHKNLIALLLTTALLAQQPAADTPTFRTTTNLVVLTVFVRGKDGRPVTGLKKEDIQVLENGKPQTLSLFEFQKLDNSPTPQTSNAIVTAENIAPTQPKPAEPKVTNAPQRYRDRRLLVMFFDWSSMGPADQIRAKEAAEKFVRQQMTTADLVSIMSFGSSLVINQEFTDDRDQLLSTIRRFQTGEASELAGLANTDVDSADDAAFSLDETEFNIFNTDRKLGALEDAANKLAGYREKKALVYFSAGVTRSGADNESQLRATINAAVRANVSFYPVDVRGLVAMPPGGDASTAGGRGTGLYTGQTQSRQRQQNNDAQDTLFALAGDTGGKALLDNNDLVLGIKQAQEDLQSYYLIGYYSSDDSKNGRFRKVEVKLLNRQVEAKLDYRRGYFGEKDFKAFNELDKERQLEEALVTGDPLIDLPLALEVDYFRLDNKRYFVPVTVKVPGSIIPLKKQGGSETTQFDFIGQVRDDKNVMLASVRDNITIKLRDEKAGKLGGANLLYDTGFTLGPGKFKVKMLVRENQSGKMGTFETTFVIPDISAEKNAVKLSSVVWSNQRTPVTEAVGAADKKNKLVKKHPLVRDGQKLAPSVTRVFRPGQTVWAYAEVYDPTTNEEKIPTLAGVIGLYRDGKKIWESRPMFVRKLEEGRKDTAGVLLEVPLRDNLETGTYTAQLTIIDTQGKRFGAARSELAVLAPKPLIPLPPPEAPAKPQAQ